MRGVPYYFIIDGEVALSGAGEVTALLQAFDRAESVASTAEGGACRAGERASLHNPLVVGPS